MVKVLVIGAGAQGGPCASILAGEESVDQIRLGDINLEIAQNVADKIGCTKVQPIKLDASMKSDLLAAADGVDVILNFTLIKYNEIIIYIALGIWGEYAAILPEVYRKAKTLGLGLGLPCSY